MRYGLIVSALLGEKLIEILEVCLLDRIISE
jgi:hypothetical protein